MSLHGEYDSSNIFAKILRGEMPAIKVFEDDQLIAIMDVFPQSRGHTLIIPREAARNLLELSDAAASHAITVSRKIACAVETALAPDGIIVTQFNGAPAGQSVFHVHFHVIPRWSNQELAGHSHGKMADMAELEAIAAQIRAALNSLDPA